ncbi:MAG: hypothetical protein N2738_00950, partial [Thermodesulfovibrionales bacterium]|nr:hypothetical protein [Thermodesulfovibrionales bacterium]
DVYKRQLKGRIIQVINISKVLTVQEMGALGSAMGEDNSVVNNSKVEAESQSENETTQQASPKKLLKRVEL